MLMLNWKYPDRLLVLCTEKWWMPIQNAFGFQRGNWFIGFMRFHGKRPIQPSDLKE